MSGTAAPPAGSTVLTGSVGATPLRTAAVLEAITRAILTGANLKGATDAWPR